MKTKNGYEWAAGLFEGEGSLSVMQKTGGRPSIQLSITSVDYDVLERFQEAVGFGTIYGPYRNTRGNCKPQYQWRGHGWNNLHNLFQNWSGLLGTRREARFREVLALQPEPYRWISKRRSLVANEVKDIRKRLERGEDQRSIAARFGISQTGISDIKLKQTYKEIL